MRKLAWGAALVGTTACLSVAVTGIAGAPGPLGSVLPPLPRASAQELKAFEDCDELLDWYVEKALPLVGPWGFGYGYPYPMVMEDGVRGFSFLARDMATFVPAAAPWQGGMGPVSARADTAIGSSDTGTNVQEIGVDEPDVAKTDGNLIYRLSDNRLVVTDVSGDDPVELSRTKLPDKFSGEGLLLVGDTVVVTANSYDDGWGGRVMFDMAYKVSPGTARIATYDVSIPEKPSLRSDEDFEGTLVEARQYGDTVRLVLQTGTPELDFVQPGRRRTEREATRENRDIVRNSTIDDWLPTVEVDGKRSRLVACEDVRHPRTDSGFGTISIVTFEAATPLDRSTLAVTTSGSLAYSSTDRLYVATPEQPEVEPFGWFDRMRPIEPDTAPARTEVHAFELDGTATTYVASGKVEGQIRDRWSFDEYDGHLRVATAHTKNWATVDNGVTVLREDGTTLRVVGSVRGLGRNEEIQSVRWFDDLAVVVTFRQVDPLYTVDLKDPSNPKVLGELKIPGFSSYLHPIGDDRLLGIGTAATVEGRTLGAQIATFDLSDLRDPRQLSVLKMRDADLTASYDPHAFTFVGHKAWTLAHTWSGGGAYRMLEIEVGTDGELTEVASYPARYDTRTMPISGDRVALVGNEVRLLPNE